MAPSLIAPIAYAAGKSGGHIIPCLTLLFTHPSDPPPLFFTTNAPLDIRIIQQSTFPLTHITLPLGYSYGSWYAKILLIWHLLVAFCKSFVMLAYYKPAKLVTTGGLVALPVSLAAYIMRIPIILHELNAIPGRATRCMGMLATEIHLCFPGVRQYFNAARCHCTPYPLKYTERDRTASRATACSLLGLSSDVPTILILGGSQGSAALNSLAPYIAQAYGTRVQLIHQVGTADSFDWPSWYAQQPNITACVFTYRDNLAPCIVASDCVIGRAGAGTLFELIYFKKPSIIIPLEGAADDHQVANAHAIAEQYPALCTVVRQQTGDATLFYERVLREIGTILNIKPI
jgi:UDP-N-acetylglucosamine--N-acetylmuramyl-(pentapeptide) pyrophosphoryl-undecaprenol N-acetylglucosamine transferase